MTWLRRLKAATETEDFRETLRDGTDKTDKTPFLSVLAVAGDRYSDNPRRELGPPEWEALERAIYHCCYARGDSDEHRAALLADCLREEPDDWGWWLNYFQGEECKTLNNPIGRTNG